MKRIIKVHRNPQGKAFKTLFDFIQKNFSVTSFCVDYLPDVTEAFVKEVEQVMGKSGRFWMGPGANTKAKRDVLDKMSNVGLLSFQRVVEEIKEPRMPPIEKVVYTLTESGKHTKVLFGD